MPVCSAAFARARQSVTLDKNVTRSTALSFRNSIHRSLTPVKTDVYNKLFNHLQNDVLTALYGTAKPVVAGYYPIGSEFDVIPLLQRFYGHNHTVCLPVIQDDVDEDESPLVFWEWVPGSETANGKVRRSSSTSIKNNVKVQCSMKK